MIEIIAVAVLWYALGFAGFVYWWTKDYDFTQSEIGGAVFFAFLGPITFVMGWMVHGDTDKVLFKKRGQ